MAMEEPYSHSRLECFRKCPQQFRYRYLDQIPSRRRGIEAFMGSRVHEALEFLYRELMEGRSVGEDTLVQHYLARWDREFGDDVHVVKEGRSPEDYRRIGVTCLEDYYRSRAPFPDAGRTLGLELLVEFHLDDGESYPIRGYVDRLVRGEDDFLEIHDYKTSNRMPTDADLDQDGQLALYQIGLGKVFPEQAGVRLVWHYLVHGKRAVREKTSAQLAALKRKTCTTIDTILATSVFPARTSILCRWCDYQGICPEGRRFVESMQAPSRNEAGLVWHYSRIKKDAIDPGTDPESLRLEAGLLKNNIRDYVIRSGKSVLVGEAGRLVVEPPKSARTGGQDARWSIRLES